ncbi:PE-PGRS family protein [Streptomyces sp. SPB074]|nr:PE-PGRS family protein [Streptomyces sp. SPB074]
MRGLASSAEAPLLAIGTPYRSSVRPADGALYYRVELPGGGESYASVVAVPPPGTRLTYGDGVRVTLRDTGGGYCDSADANAAGTLWARPMGAVVEQTPRPAGACAAPGTYYVVVERTTGHGTDAVAPSLDAWALDLRLFTEPAPRTAPPASAPPRATSSPPAPPGGTPREREGGAGPAGLGDEARIGPGTWRDRLRPGTTRYYALPLDWGRRAFVEVELGSAVASGSGRKTVASALRAGLDSPVRAEVVADSAFYTGSPSSAHLDTGAPVAFANRWAGGGLGALRFPGTYVVRVSLSPELAAAYGDEPLGVVLRVAERDEGRAGRAVTYPGDAGIFRADGKPADGPRAQRRAAAPEGGGMRWLAAGSFAAGLALLGWLGVWRLRGRRTA